ncbi:MAG: hypothetical protein SFW62_01475 [Alphaproteobacteria bacterium]|nr:hypothetical protein [Alphaproteobacteria bacterium]
MPFFKAFQRTPKTTFLVAALILAVLAVGFEGFKIARRHYGAYRTETASEVPAGISHVAASTKDSLSLHGWAPAQATVQIRDRDEVVATAKTNNDKKWVASLSGSAGGSVRNLTVRYQEEGKEAVDVNSFGLFMPGRLTDGMYLWRQDSSLLHVLQSPFLSEEGDLSLALAAAQEDRPLVFSGRGIPGSLIQLYLDNELSGTASTNPEGFWSLSLLSERGKKSANLRLDEIVEQSVAERHSYRLEWAESKTAWLAEQPGSDKGIILIFRPGSGEIADPQENLPGQIIPHRPSQKKWGIFRR